MSAGAGLEARFAAHLASGDALAGGDGVVVALSGGVDSVVLLHLFRFGAGLPDLRLRAAHVDHGMRPGSAADAAWVAGLCRAWGVPLTSRRLDPPPLGEARARRLRYAFLEEVRLAEGARWVATAHHADDQAETVLFRAVRGAGVAGLRGIRERRRPGVWRPLLPFTRAEVRGYAEARGLGWREDPTNTLPLARNVLRHRVLPELEARVAPGARRALARLARHARAEEAAWRSLEGRLLEEAGLREEEGGWSLDRAAFAAYHPEVRARLLRALARRLGVRPLEAGTRRGVELSSAASRGGSVPLGEGLTLHRELDRLLLAPDRRPGPDRAAVISDGGPGSSEAALGGVIFRVRWGVEPEGRGDAAAFAPGSLALPLTVRGWRPGDRIRLPYGTKKLKKLLLEARIPRSRRTATPVVVDARGEVVWVPGVARAAGTEPRPDEDVMTIEIAHADAD